MTFSSGRSESLSSILLPTGYLPPVSYVSACLRADEVRIEMHETYTKQTFRNHCVIMGPNGKQVLSIPVISIHGNHTKTRDIRISGDSPWQRLHWRSVTTAYSNSPFFLYYQDFFLPSFRKRHEFLIDLNTSLLETIFRILKVDKHITGTPDFVKPGTADHDLRFAWRKKRNDDQLVFPQYTQVFSERHGFIPDLSILDLIFNLGPEALSYLENLEFFF